MNANDLLNIVLQVILFSVTLKTTWAYFGLGDRARRDIALLFGSLSIPFLVQDITRLFGQPIPVLQVLSSCALAAEPYLLLRVGRYFQTIPPYLLRIASRATVIFWVAVALSRLLPPVAALITGLLLILYFAATNGYTMQIFFRGAWTTPGILRNRLRFAAAGSGLMAMAIGVIIVEWVFMLRSDMLTTVIYLLVVGALLCFYTAFAPSRWQRYTWQLIELRLFLVNNREHSVGRMQSVEDALEALCEGANNATAGIFSAVFQYEDEGDRRWSLRCSSPVSAKMLDALNANLDADSLKNRLRDDRTSHYLRTEELNDGSDGRLLQAIGAANVLIVPMVTSQGVWGLLLTFLKNNSLFIDDDLEMLELLVWQTASALENDRMMAEVYRYSAQLEQEIAGQVALVNKTEAALEQTQAYARRQDLLNEMSQKINTATTEEAVYRAVGDAISKIVNATSFTIFMLHDEPDKLIVALTEPEEMVVSTGQIVPAKSKLTEAVLMRGEISNFGNVEEAVKDIQPQYAAPFLRTGLNSFLTVPVYASQKIIGAVAVRTRDKNAYTTEDESLVMHIASFLGIAVENLRRYHDVQRAILIAEKASRAKSEFLATMSHELRTPLNGILGYVQILRKDKEVTSRQREGLEIIDRSSEHLLTLINDILDLSKIEAQRMELSNAAFHLSDMLKSVCHLVQVRAEMKDLVFRYEQLSDLPIGVYGDELRLRQVLLNLLGNAVKYTGRGGVVLKVGFQEERLRFQIEDTGVGIDAEALKTLFQPFQQVGKRNTGVEGTGLGLAISSQLIALMGGQLMVKSQPGEGSTFWFELILPAEDDFITVPTLPEENIIGYTGEVRRVLVVDDRMENRAVLNGMLTPLGFEVIEVSNGQECLDVVTDFKPHVILMDLRMPVMSGLETMRLLRRREETNGVILIAISASAFEHDEQASRSAGANDFLPKPFRLQRLLDLLRLYLKLEWIIEAGATPVVENKPQEISAPPPDNLSHLFDLARRGDVHALTMQCDELSRAGYPGFASVIRGLAQEFKLREIRQFIDHHRNQQSA